MTTIHTFSFIFIGLAASSGPAASQPPAGPAPEVRTAMAKFAWLEGDWRGEGWRAGPAGKETFEVAETARFRLGGVILTVEGRGWTVGEDGQEVEGHNAFGVLSYDAYQDVYRFDAFVKEGYQSRTEPDVGENEYRWSHPAGPGAEMRYHARLTEDDDWLETGERCVEGECAQIFEMRLSRVEAD